MCQECVKYKHGGVCKDECPQDYYADEHSHICSRCASECQGCTGPSNNQCLSCRNETATLKFNCTLVIQIGFTFSIWFYNFFWFFWCYWHICKTYVANEIIIKQINALVKSSYNWIMGHRIATDYTYRQTHTYRLQTHNPISLCADWLNGKSWLRLSVQNVYTWIWKSNAQYYKNMQHWFVEACTYSSEVMTE